MDEELELLRPNMIASMALLNKRGFNAATFIDIGAAEGGFYLLRRQMDLFPGAAHFFVDAMQENEAIYQSLSRSSAAATRSPRSPVSRGSWR